MLVRRSAVGLVMVMGMLACITGMVVVMRRGLSGFLRKRARTTGAIVRAVGLRFVHDPANGPRTAPALRAAVEAAIDLAGHARRIGPDHSTNLMIRQDVTGADDHIRRFSLRCSSII